MVQSTPLDVTTVFAEASRPDRVRSIIEERLRTPDAPPFAVTECDVAFARRGELRSLFQYDVTLRDPADGAIRHEVVTGVAYPGRRTRRIWDRIQLSQPLEPAQGAWLARAAYVPELELVLQVFPFDSQMPALESLLADRWPPLVAPLLGDFGPDDWRIEAWRAETIRYRVDQRVCVRLNVEARDAGTGDVLERRYFAKVYTSESQAAEARSVQEDLTAAIAAGRAGFSLAPVIAFLPDHQVLVQGEAAGKPLGFLVQQDDGAIDAVRRTARAIASLHLLDVTAPAHRGAVERVGPDRVRRGANRLRAARPDLEAAIRDVEGGINAAFDAAGEAPAVPVHGDLRPNHVLIDGDRVTLLDLDKFGAGDPMLDVANIAASLRRRVSGAAERAFLDEYFARVPRAWERRFRPVYAAGLLAEASALFKNPQRGARRHVQQADRAAHVLEEAKAILD